MLRKMCQRRSRLRVVSTRPKISHLHLVRIGSTSLAQIIEGGIEGQPTRAESSDLKLKTEASDLLNKYVQESQKQVWRLLHT